MYAEIGTTIRSGSCILSESVQPAHSFIRNFMLDIRAGFVGVGSRYNLSGTTRGALYAEPTDSTYNWCEGGFALNYGSEEGGSAGIVVGSGDTPFSPFHNNLVMTIPHGDVDNTLHRSAMSLIEPTIAADGQSISIEYRRSFANNGSVDVTVKEVGLIGKPGYDGYYLREYYDHILYMRDVLDAPICVIPGKQLDVVIRVKTEL